MDLQMVALEEHQAVEQVGHQAVEAELEALQQDLQEHQEAVAVAVEQELLHRDQQQVAQVAQEQVDKFWCGTNMWAAIENGIVKDYYITVEYSEMIKDAENKGYTDLVEMTLENSPAYIDGIWDGKNFHKVGE
jgi:hypothetical protein